MEEIKFRGQRVDNKKWVYGYYFKTPLTDEATGSSHEDGWFFLSGRERHCIAQGSCVYEVIPETVGQYTGIDEIYNGDILTADYYPFKDDDKLNYNAEVYWDKWALQFCIRLHCVNPNKGGISDGMCEALTEREIKFEKIGNIFDNPELLNIL